MIELLAKKRLPRETLKKRRQEIERCLATFGVLKAASRGLRRPRLASREPMDTHRLRQALEHLGPIFSAFGLYMASRVDLLPARACRELATITDWGEVTPIATVRELLSQELGRSYEAVFPVFADEPFESRLFFQSHHACLNDGKAVTVTVAHPDLQAYFACDIELLPVLQPVFAGGAWLHAALADAIADFRRLVQWQTDFLFRVKAFETLARDSQEFAMLAIPKVYREISSSRVLTLEHISGTTLREILGAVEGAGPGRTRGAHALSAYTDLQPQTLARRLCMVWLRQALLGMQFPIEWRSEDLVLLPNTQIAFTGGVFATLPSEAKKNLWHYMITTANDDPDKACSYLLRELVQEGESSHENELRCRFREVVPFRDGGWSDNEVGSHLSAQLFVHWKLVSEHGLQLQPHLLCFYRGLFQMLTLVQRLAPEGDALLEGLQDVRTIVMLAQFQEMMALPTLGDSLDKHTAMLMALPRKLDEVLTLAVERGPRGPSQETRGVQLHGRHRSATVVLALLLALASAVLLSHHLMASGSAGVWVERGSAIVFVVLGALVLRAASRT